MNSRRDFFRQFIGQAGILRDDFRGVRSIPLNRLNELPENIITDIEPVFFPDEIWYLNEGVLHIPERKSSGRTDLELSEIELIAFNIFGKGARLKAIAVEINRETGRPYDDVYITIKSLFFKLASLHICHPADARPIDEILNGSGISHAEQSRDK
jgi:hypothetical protein